MSEDNNRNILADRPNVNPFSPKEQYQKFQVESAAELVMHTNSKWLRVSLDAALAQMSAGGADDLELRGARRFIETLLDLAEKNTTVGKLPKIELTTFDNP
jgi:hypothetical protein